MNTLEFFKKHNKNQGVVRGYFYVLMYIIDTADLLMFEAIEGFKKVGMFNTEVKKNLNNAYKHLQRAMSIVRLYSGESWEEALLKLDGFVDDFEREKLVLYNTVLRDCARDMAEDYEVAKALAFTGSASLLASFAVSLDLKLRSLIKKDYLQSAHAEALKVTISSVRQLLYCKRLDVDSHKELDQKVVDHLCGACGMYAKAVEKIMDDIVEEFNKKENGEECSEDSL